MSARERQERQAKAIYEGRLAYREGKSLDDCPYKRSNWGVGGFWDMGFNREKADTQVISLMLGPEVDKYLSNIDAKFFEGMEAYREGHEYLIRQVMIRPGMPPLRIIPSEGIMKDGKAWACIEFKADPVVPGMYIMTLRKNVEVPRD